MLRVPLAPFLTTSSDEVRHTIWHQDYLCVIGGRAKVTVSQGRPNAVVAISMTSVRQFVLPVAIGTYGGYSGGVRGFYLEGPRLGNARHGEVFGVAFGPKYGDVVGLVSPSWKLHSQAALTLREPFSICCQSSSATVGPVSVATRKTVPCVGAWTPETHRRRLSEAFEAAGKTGFVAYNANTNAIRTLDTGEPLLQVELRRDGLVAAAISRDSVFLFDLGDD
jgi:hypothetical protein